MKFPIPNLYTYSEVINPKWLIIFVHWLTSSQDEEMFVEGQKSFNENWYSTLRFNLYGDWPEERKLNEIWLQDNIDDVNCALKFWKELGYKSIFLVWHSYWGIANLYVNHSSVTWLLMWDSSIWWKWLLQDVYEDWNWWHYINRWDWCKYLISEKWYEDFLIPSKKYLEKISEIQIPVLVIWAENWLADVARKYYDYANEPKELNIILWADHRFLDWWMDELFVKSLAWIQKFS
jgi:pimeloyl-ACP methyl ester carboxylesterase